MIDLLKYRYLYLLISGIIIIPGLFFLGIGGLKPGIDFVGGSELTVVMPKGVNTTSAAIEQTVRGITYKVGNATRQFEDVSAQGVSDTKNFPTQQEYLVRTRDIGADVTGQKALVAGLGKVYNKGTAPSQQVRQVSFNSVSGTVGADTTRNTILAVVVAAIAILLYMAYAFRKLRHPFVYGGAAVAALLHDVLVVLGLFAFLGFFFNIRIDSLFVPAVLTVIGFSVHDTIVVFDRIRENMGRRTGEPYYTVVNNALAQTLGRSLNTSITVILTLLALVLFGGESIRTFVLALLIGIISGTYSSIFNATPLAVIWETGEFARLFGRGKGPGGGAARPVARSTGTAR